MELNAKISSLEDEVKLLKGEVKLILSEIRAAVLDQNNPFSSSPGLAIDQESPGTRPGIRVVKVPTEGEEAESEATPNLTPAWNQEEEPSAESSAEEPAPAYSQYEEPPPVRPVEERQAESSGPAAGGRYEAPPPPRRDVPAAEMPPATSRAEAPAAKSTPRWSLIKVAGLTVWAEEALKQVGPERLETLLDLCEFAGYMPSSAKEALMRVMNLGIAIDERTETPSVNECLVILYQLHALMQEEEPEVLRGRLSAGK
jgi:hypothetical protein